MKYRQLKLMQEAARLLSKGSHTDVSAVGQFITQCLPWTEWDSKDASGIPGLGKLIENGRSSVNDMRRYVGTFGVLTFLSESSNAGYVDSFLGLCLQELDIIVQKSLNAETIVQDHEELERHIYQFVSALCDVSRNHSAYEQQIISRLWKLSLDLCERIRKNDGAYLQVAVAITFGILRALRKSVTGLDARSMEFLESLGTKLFDADVLKKIHKASSMIDCESGVMPSYPERYHDSIFVGIQMFRLLETFLVYGLVKSKDQVDAKVEAWDWVANTSYPLQPSQEGDMIKFITSMFKYLWCTAWPLDDSASDGVYYLQSMTMRCSSICCLYVPELAPEFIANAVAFLDDVELSVDLATLTSVIEALCLVGFNIPSVSGRVLELFVKMLSKPSHLFLKIMEKRFFISLCHTFSRSIVKCLQANPDKNLVKSILFTFLKSFTPAQKTEDNNELLNAMTLIANLVKVLDNKEVSEIVIPAFARLLETANPDLEDEILEVIGEMCLYNNPAYFGELLDLILKHEKLSLKSVTNVCICIARDSTRPVKLSTTFLKAVIYKFLLKASKANLGIQDNDFRNELREIAHVICTILGNKNYHPEVKDDDHLALYIQNFWFSLIMVVMNTDGLWPQSWKSVVQLLAEKSLPLVLPPNAKSVEAHLASCAAFQLAIPDSLNSQFQNNLAFFLPSKAFELRLSPSQNVYLLAIYHLEMSRTSRSSLSFIFEYLKDDRVYQTMTYSLYETIAELVLKKFFRIRKETRDIENAMLVALSHVTHRLPRVRVFARLVIKNVLEKFPGVIWNIELFTYLLKQLQLAVDSTQEMSFYFSSSDIVELANSWVSLACKVSPGHIFTMIQAFLAKNMDYDAKSSIVITNLLQKVDVGTNFQYLGSKFTGELTGMISVYEENGCTEEESIKILSARLSKDLEASVVKRDGKLEYGKLANVIYRTASIIGFMKNEDTDLLDNLCEKGIHLFDPAGIRIFLNALTWITSYRPALSAKVLENLCQLWERSAVGRLGIYSKPSMSLHAFFNRISYGSPEKQKKESNEANVHLQIVRFLLFRFQTDCFLGKSKIQPYVNLILSINRFSYLFRHHWNSREVWFALCKLELQVANAVEQTDDKQATLLWTIVFEDTLNWFTHAPIYGECFNDDINEIYQVYKGFKMLDVGQKNIKPKRLMEPFDQYANLPHARKLLVLLLENEIHRLSAWLDPISARTMPSLDMPSPGDRTVKWRVMVKAAWSIRPAAAVLLRSRFPSAQSTIDSELLNLSTGAEMFASDVQESLFLLRKKAVAANISTPLRYILYWANNSPILVIGMLGNKSVHPWVLQYAVKVLESFPIDYVFFYVPQLVQALRYDSYGFIEGFIAKAGKSSQLFAHQIIWNMKANMFKDEDSLHPDSLKPVLDRLLEKIVSSFSVKDRAFYEMEFEFFKEVTGISGTLKPLVQSGATKADKKKKIDEEFAKIVVKKGAYLPTNPESIVLDIDRKSGRPLQSHAKAPFMATFKVKDSEGDGPERWMASIFKVGDDCRQDVLALQIISVFKNVFSTSGLDMYVFPYRVLATEPGCGVIEVIPNSISRDMMGREKVNNLYDWYLAEFGNEVSVDFQRAQREFVKSQAAYSVISYILQIKDRHNGNIMFDKEGHIVHIDFGFILSIAPGGGILEVSPFKLTAEMVQVMGGDINSPLYKEYSELCVKAYLAVRPYAEEIVELVSLMMDSSLPCFKGEISIRKLRERFQLERSERSAAEFMISLIRQSHENTRSGLYDRFQYMQNGIPFK